MKTQFQYDTIGLPDVSLSGYVRVSFQPEDNNETLLLDYLCDDSTTGIKKSESGEEYEYAFAIIPPPLRGTVTGRK